MSLIIILSHGLQTSLTRYDHHDYYIMAQLLQIVFSIVIQKVFLFPVIYIFSRVARIDWKLQMSPLTHLYNTNRDQGGYALRQPLT